MTLLVVGITFAGHRMGKAVIKISDACNRQLFLKNFAHLRLIFKKIAGQLIRQNEFIPGITAGQGSF